MNNLPDKIVTIGRKYLGVKFRHQGRNELGLDCAGLIVVILKQLGYEINEVQGYGLNPHKGRLEKAIASHKFLKLIPYNDAEIGDILLIKFKTEPQHLAIKTDIGILHATSTLGFVGEHRFTPDFGEAVCAYRVLPYE